MPHSNIDGAVIDRIDLSQLDASAEFELDVQVTADAAAGYTVRRCDSSDGCGSTCGSACVSD